MLLNLKSPACLARSCLWYGPWNTRPLCVFAARDHSQALPSLSLFSLGFLPWASRFIFWSHNFLIFQMGIITALALHVVVMNS